MPLLTGLSEETEQEMRNMLSRVDKIAKVTNVLKSILVQTNWNLDQLKNNYLKTKVSGFCF